MADFVKMSLPSWITDHKRWEKPTLGNIILPGVVHTSQVGTKLRTQHDKASGKDGGDIRITGLEIPKFMFRLTLNSKEEEDAWNKIAPLFLPRKDPRQRKVLPVYHPSLARFQIVACIVEHVNETMPSGDQPLMAEIHCLAVSPPKNNATKRIKAKVITPNAKSPDAINLEGGKNAGPQRFSGVTPPSQKAPLK